MNSETPANAKAAWPSPLRGWYLVGVLWLAYVASYVDRLMLAMMVEPVKASLGFSDTGISLLIGLSFALFYAIMGLPLARIADKGNRKHLILAGVALWSIATAFCGLARTQTMLFLARIGVGVGEATLHPGALSLISDHFPAERKSLPITVFLTASFAGTAIAFIVGGWIIGQADVWIEALPWLAGFEPWQVAFFVASLPGVLVLLLMLPIREPLRRELRTGVDLGLPLREVFAIMREDWRSYAAILGGPLFICIFIFGQLAWMPTLMGRIHGLPPESAGAMIGGIFLIAGPAGVLSASALGQRLMRKGRRDGLMLIAIACAVLGAGPGIVVGLATDSSMAGLCYGLFVLLGGGVTILPQAMLQMLAPNQIRGQVAAIWNFLISLVGLGLGPTLIAGLSDTISPAGDQLGTAMAIVGAVAMTAGTVMLVWGLSATRVSFSRRV